MFDIAPIFWGNEKPTAKQSASPGAALTHRPGFSRTEVVVIIVIGGILLAVLIVTLRVHRDETIHSATHIVLNDLRQMALACRLFEDVHKKLPPAFDRSGRMEFPASIHVHLLPFIDQPKLYESLIQLGRVEEDHTLSIYCTPLRGHEDPRGVQTNAANLRVFSDKGVNTLFDANMPALDTIEPGNATLKRTFKDGLSTTIIFSTKHGYCGEGGSRYAAAPNSAFAAFFGQNAARRKAHPSDPTATFQLRPALSECRTTPLMAQSFSSDFVMIALADGSARMVWEKISPQVWNSAMQPNDGKQLGDDWSD